MCVHFKNLGSNMHNFNVKLQEFVFNIKLHAVRMMVSPYLQLSLTVDLSMFRYRIYDEDIASEASTPGSNMSTQPGGLLDGCAIGMNHDGHSAESVPGVPVASDPPAVQEPLAAHKNAADSSPPR